MAGHAYIDPSETIVGAPDSTILNQKYRNNIYEYMKANPMNNAGFEFTDNPSIIYDVNGYQNLTGGTTGARVYYKGWVWIPDGITDLYIQLYAYADISGPQHYFQIRFYNRTTAITYTFDLYYIPNPIGRMDVILTGLTGGASYWFDIYARKAVGATNCAFVLSGVLLRPYVL